MRISLAGTRSFAGRATLMYVGTVLLMLCIIASATAFSQMLTIGRTLSLAMPRAKVNAATLITAQIRERHALPAAAAYASEHMHRPDVVLNVYSNDAGIVFSSQAQWSAVGTGVDYLMYALVSGIQGFAPLEARKATVPGGFLYVDPNFVYVSRLIAEGFFQFIPFAIVALAIAYAGGLLNARRAAFPLKEVAAQLHLLADGNFTLRPVVDSEASELCALSAAYNEAARSSARAVAERAGAAENIRSFTSDAGQELKTPAAIISGYLEAAAGLVTDQQDVLRIVNKTLLECRRMRDTIAKLSTVARLDSDVAQVGSFDIVMLVRDVVDSMRPLMPNVHIDMPEDEDIVASGDRDELREAIAHIVDNAVKYAPGSPIDVRVAVSADDVKIEIVDAGPGMNSNDRAHAFDRFYRGSSRASVEGSGLGLTIAKRAVERAKGKIVLATEPGHGTVVTMLLRRVSRDGTGNSV